MSFTGSQTSTPEADCPAFTRLQHADISPSEFESLLLKTSLNDVLFKPLADVGKGRYFCSKVAALAIYETFSDGQGIFEAKVQEVDRISLVLEGTLGLNRPTNKDLRRTRKSIRIGSSLSVYRQSTIQTTKETPVAHMSPYAQQKQPQIAVDVQNIAIAEKKPDRHSIIKRQKSPNPDPNCSPVSEFSDPFEDNKKPQADFFKRTVSANFMEIQKSQKNLFYQIDKNLHRFQENYQKYTETLTIFSRKSAMIGSKFIKPNTKASWYQTAKQSIPKAVEQPKNAFQLTRKAFMNTGFENAKCTFQSNCLANKDAENRVFALWKIIEPGATLGCIVPSSRREEVVQCVARGNVRLLTIRKSAVAKLLEISMEKVMHQRCLMLRECLRFPDSFYKSFKYEPIVHWIKVSLPETKVAKRRRFVRRGRVHFRCLFRAKR